MIDQFESLGWTRLKFRFDPAALDHLNTLEPHVGRGRRLTDMAAMSKSLPDDLKNEIRSSGFNPAPLRAVGFKKSSEENWSLPWHQDRVIAMPQKTSNPNLKNWSRKSGVWHCEPSPEILAQIAFAYIGFDDIQNEMGGLEIAEGSHKFGSIPHDQVDKHVEALETVCPNITAGQALLVSALTLHRSAPMKIKGNRRTLRIDFGAAALNLSI